ncbi:phosphate/phosphite/phosphonate ABC transporter substrate-binding protein [Alteribacter keqinensis]|uniref:Phosphate/phosphite/phosphonate ABC transporter substrate-binding protein n=1 Tax=Alteribacter keqinensis TaxID=2483800 RepID=A0A3M7U1D0_9BACI|nr:phosphate/phosphite/phosphonate ABC transporter substrate-binding protein [Alteribacter keqinensis]RNA70475.1 phosphate/phosphite/phosphonate ABC transporter substrate-binding protein [Alteribacter keqinensis]
MKKILMMSVGVMALSLAACGNGDEEDALVMGFVPSSDSDNIASTVEPLADELSEILGRPVEGSVMVNYSGLVEAMGSGNVDIGFLPALGYVQGEERYGFEVILKSERNGEDSYRAQFVVHEESGIDNIEDLEGKSWVYPDPASPAGFLFPATHLAENYGVEDVQSFFGEEFQAGSNDGALVSVYEGEADVATTFEDARSVLTDDYPDIMDTLKVIEYTEAIPNDTITLIEELDEDLKAEIKEAFLSFNENEEMIQIMNDVYRWDGIIEADPSDYDIVRDAYNLFRDDISLD